MAKKKQIVGGSRVVHRKTCRKGTVVDMKFTIRAPYHCTECLVRWGVDWWNGSETYWVKAKLIEVFE
jgi:hypothetical protein